MNKITLKRRTDSISGKSFYDYIIDGKSLYETLDLENTDFIGILGWEIKYDEKTIVRQLLNVESTNELESGRIMIFICSKCGDICSAAKTISLIETENSIIWTEFSDEDLFEIFENTEHSNIGSFEFDKTSYKKLFNEYLKRIS